jgi:hypothetical protein
MGVFMCRGDFYPGREYNRKVGPKVQIWELLTCSRARAWRDNNVTVLGVLVLIFLALICHLEQF